MGIFERSTPQTGRAQASRDQTSPGESLASLSGELVLEELTTSETTPCLVPGK